MRQIVKTFDEHDAKEPVKPFPIDKPYLLSAAKVWLESYLLFIEKSRQLMFSWLLIILHLHLAQFTPHRRIFFQSKREDDAKAMIDRAWFVWESQPTWIKTLHPATRTTTKIEFANGSEIVGIPHGPNVLRQYTSSAVLSDEQAFQEDAEESFGAAMPTITGGGRFTGVSTANPGFFYSATTKAKEQARSETQIQEGVTYWKGADGKFSVLRVHYSADPDPKTQQKVNEAKDAYISAGRIAWFKKEYEIDYGALSGELIWPELNPEVHILTPFSIPHDWPRYRAIDPGWRNPCGVIWAAVAPLGWRDCQINGKSISPIIIYREFRESQWTVPDIAKAIKHRSLGESFVTTLIDPSAKITRGNESAGRNTFEQFQQEGLGVIPANNAVDAGLDDVRRRLCIYGKSPALYFFSNLTHTWREITHYRYQQLSARVMETADPPEKPMKKDDHLADCVRYLCSYAPLRLPDEYKYKPVETPKRTFKQVLNQQTQIAYQRGLLGNAFFRNRVL